MAESMTMAVTCGVTGHRAEVGVELPAIAHNHGPDLGVGLDLDVTM